MDEAARQAGIPIEEVYQRVTERSGQVDTLNWQLRLIAQSSLEKSLTKLTQLASGEARVGKDFESTDMLAAQALAKLAIDAIKLVKLGAAKTEAKGEKDDLFDAMGPWKLRKIE